MGRLSSVEPRAASDMNTVKQLAVMMAGACLAISGAVAQTNPTVNAAEPVRDGKVVVAERLTADGVNLSVATSLRPTRPERPNLPPEVTSRLERFKVDARAYLAQQQALKKKLEGANDQDRAALQERLRALREQWQERALEMRKEYKDRQRELADKLPEYRELLDNLRSSAQQQAREAQAETRTRRGDP
jgi:hypothetical protein